MRKKEKFIKISDLSVSHVLLDFVNKELLPGTGISSNQFWKEFSKTVHDLSPKNKKLLETREKIQKSIDSFHDGHYTLFKEIIKKTGQVCIQIRDVQGVDEIGRAHV